MCSNWYLANYWSPYVYLATPAISGYTWKVVNLFLSVHNFSICTQLQYLFKTLVTSAISGHTCDVRSWFQFHKSSFYQVSSCLAILHSSLCWCRNPQWGCTSCLVPGGPHTDLPAYSDTVYSDTPLTVTLFACTSQMIGLLLNYLWLQWQSGYSDTFPMSRGCHCKRGPL